ncbi:fructose-bisphosphate aldolase [Coriobacterium glomerans PW2]|uniref:Fructose-bisphosphate aldolase n=1 Tax=Coriobacterium glomerans (strain ATCC 49209 / DSM 20642 / JCM 10262 / PW2) TaxID=700015 RepID=F2N9Y2_CORGP|nr:class II fructose-bisphosphate aldolase [Coriobacterium glomerans]AEB06237.1 fructose-bisphosphate aldolase [Coriobacterium glomerans PW2]
MYVTLREVLAEATRLNMAIGSFNTHNIEMLPAIIRAAANQKTPVIIQTSEGTASYIGQRNLVAVCRSMAEEYGVDVVLHLDHAKDFAEIRKAVDAGFSSVMFDGSALPFKENILGTKRVVAYARGGGASVEGELGTVGGTEDGICISKQQVCYTDPDQASEFIELTGIDALAVAIGTNHGQYRSKTSINFDQLERIRDAVHGFPLVIHGGTGVRDEDVRRVIDLGIRKFNVGTDLLVHWNRASLAAYEANKENTSNREDVLPALDAVAAVVEHRIELFKNISSAQSGESHAAE